MSKTRFSPSVGFLSGLVLIFLVATVSMLLTCSFPDFPETGPPPSGPPEDEGFDFPSGPPEDEAPPGTRWVETQVDYGCGREGRIWVLGDETCGGTESPNYLDAFVAPIFRDGTLVGDRLYAVDATHLWVLNVTDPAGVEREALASGFGRPLAISQYDGELVIASGDAGLLRVDISDPLNPSVVGRHPLPGPAMDVAVADAKAYVAAGPAGLAVIDIEEWTQLRSIAVQGFAAGVAVAGGFAYVAACDGLVVVDLSTETMASSVWLDGVAAEDAPAKDVDVVGGVAFVAAGRYGAVVVNVADPEHPEVVGNCTDEDDLLFYASGVRHEGNHLYVAAGEWGILPIAVEDAERTCSGIGDPLLLSEVPEEEIDCSEKPPWEVTDWEETSLPRPLEQRCPIQVLPAGDMVYAFGDTTRIGIRAVNIYGLDNLVDELWMAGRYDEPRLVTSVAAGSGRLIVMAYEQSLVGQLVDLQFEVEGRLPIAARAAAFLPDGRWVAASEEFVHIEEEDEPLKLCCPVTGLAATSDRIYAAHANGISVIDLNDMSVSFMPSPQTAALPPAFVVYEDAVVFAAPEWESAVEMGGSTLQLHPHGVFDSEEVLDIALWVVAPPQRLLLASDYGLIEVASIGGRAGLALHGESGDPLRLSLPAGKYMAGAVLGARAYLLSADRDTYRSMLVTVGLDGDFPDIAAIESFTGTGADVVTDGARLCVADADRGLRLFDVTSGEPCALGVIPLKEAWR